ncbi:MAG: carboxylating nicotinate-nucleotide diphosphorylase [Rhodanobacteraceae bacterium]
MRSIRPVAAEIVRRDVQRALAEDIGSGDLTADLLSPECEAHAQLITREEAVLCGAAWFTECFAQVDAGVRIDWKADEASRVPAGSLLCRMEGPARALVTAERTALNFLQTLSATATVAERYVRAVRGTRATILDTRKTIPGLREAQKYAVRVGGATNHRMGLHDAILIKENHIAAMGSVAAAVARARAMHPGTPVETEVESFAELREAVEAGADRILLDEFELDDLARAVQEVAGRIPLEVSGSVGLERVRAIAETGVDFISVGSLTKHVHAIDLSMRVDLGDRRPLTRR